MSPKKTRVKCCQECGKPLPEGRKASMRFCDPIPGSNRNKSSKCKSDWNNRQKTRGDLIYPLVMAMRYDRQNFAEQGVWKRMCRLMASWHDEDLAAGRVSFEPLNKVLDRMYDRGDLQRGEIVARNAAGIGHRPGH